MSKKPEISEVRSSGIGFGGMLTILFIALKLMNVISWSWWWVLSPLWIPIAVIGALFTVAAVCCAIADKINE